MPEALRRCGLKSAYLLGSANGKPVLYSFTPGQDYAGAGSAAVIATVDYRDRQVIVARPAEFTSRSISGLYVKSPELVTRVDMNTGDKPFSVGDDKHLPVNFDPESFDPGLVVTGDNDTSWLGTLLVLQLDNRGGPVVVWSKIGGSNVGRVIPAPPLSQIAEASR